MTKYLLLLLLAFPALCMAQFKISGGIISKDDKKPIAGVDITFIHNHFNHSKFQLY